jgi:serine protease Do
MSKFPRARFGAAVVGAFVGGLIVAGAADLTHFGWAQTKVSTAPTKTTPQEVASLIETQNAFEAIVDKTKPAVVSIHVEKFPEAREPAAQRPGGRRGQGQRGQDQGPGQIPPGLEDFFRGFEAPDPNTPVQGAGSGFIVTKDGYILTNNHVVQGADKVTVTLVDKREYVARVIGRDPTTDVAVIKIDADNLASLAMGNDATSRVGQWVLAIGNPLDLDFTVTAGIISAKGRNTRINSNRYAITDFIQTDAAINPGNSGGPLVNIRGEVIGINSAIATGTGYYAGYGFAIPITLAKDVMDDLIKYGKVRRALVGVALNDVTPEDAEAAGLKQIAGALVGDFSLNPSPAEQAGIKVGDVIVAAAGQPVDKVSTLQRIIRSFEPGQTVDLEVVRYGERRTFKVRLAEQPADPVVADNGLSGRSNRARVEPVRSVAAEKLGMTLEPLTPSDARQAQLPTGHRSGLAVTAVNPRGPAYSLLPDARIATTVIEKVMYPGPQRDVQSLADLDRVVSSARSGSVVQLQVWVQPLDGSAGQPRLISIRVP